MIALRGLKNAFGIYKGLICQAKIARLVNNL
jgi:hypothetical protein